MPVRVIRPAGTQHDLVRSGVTLLKEILVLLVDNPDLLDVKPVKTEDGTQLLVHVDPCDLGKVIGKEGRTARSLRLLLHAYSSKVAHRFELIIPREGSEDLSR